MTRIVILGTGTGVGKTYAAVALTEAITTHLPAVDVLKPIETGVSNEGFEHLLNALPQCLIQ
jgi:dethiobiotin synthetase